MKYRTKLYIALAGTALVSMLVGFIVLYYEFRKHVFADTRTKVQTVAATAAVLINPEPFKHLNKSNDQGSPIYLEAWKELIKVRDANRRSDIHIAYLYALKPNPENPAQLIYIADAEDKPELTPFPGVSFETAPEDGLHSHLNKVYSPPTFVTDPWGTWVSGYAPMYDKDGNYVATLGADISSERYLFLVWELSRFFAIAMCASLLFAFLGGYFLARQVTQSLHSLLDCVREIGRGNLTARSSLHTRDEFEELGNEINRMAHGLKEREHLKESFSRYVSYHVMEKILTAEQVAKLEGERRKITVLFSDIRQFTELAENLSPEQVVSLLNEYFEAMLEVIFRYQGTLDKFLGDGIMAEFGAPLDDFLQEKHAVLAAIEMQRALKRLNAKWQDEKKPVIHMGIGIHTGLAIVGNIGSEKRIDYTAVGDTVNVASRLEHATKLLKAPILISEATYFAVKDEIKASCLGPMILPGRKEPITTYSVQCEDV